jgi:ribose/xylose/arabinose/galactoside ABC-type transport system permease subunit
MASITVAQKKLAKTGIGLDQLRTIGLFLGIVLAGLFFESRQSAFLTVQNILTLLRSMTALGIMAFAQMFVILLGEIDLSVGAIYGLAATTVATLWLGGGALPFHIPLGFAIIIAFAVAAGIGAANAFLVTVVKIPSFIATLGFLSLAEGSELLLGNASTFNPAYNNPLPSSGALKFFHILGGSHLPFGVPIQVGWLVILFGLFWIIRHRTLFGFRIVAIGGNPRAAQIARLPIRRYKFIIFILSALMAALAGILDFSYVGSVGPNSGGSLLFPVIAAVVIGGASLNGGWGTIPGTFLGAVLLSVLANGLSLLGVGAFAQLLFVGFVTIGAVTLDRVTRQLANKRTNRVSV